MNLTRTALSAVAITSLALLGAAPATGGPPATARITQAQAPALQTSSVDRRAPENAPLRTLAGRAGIRIGTAVDMDALAADATYRSLVAREFSTVTAENVMKWGPLEPERGEYNWAPADDLVDFARRNGQKVRGHTLIWHNQLPAWLTEGNFTATELRQILRRHIFNVVGHFKGRIWHWDVANEVIDDDGELRDTIFLRTLGPGYIADAFRWAHQADPRARLYLNDYNNEGINAKSDAYYALVRRLRNERVPVHGYGMQGHFGVQYGFPGDVLENMRRFEALGLETAFTEVDVRIPLPVDAAELQAQAQGYNTLMQACLLARRCVSYTVWGFTDRYSWVPGVFPGEGAANLLDEQYVPKPAYYTIRNTLALARRR